MITPIQIFVSVANLGGELGIVGDKLRTRLPRYCPQELKDSILGQKLGLLALLRLSFVPVRSEILDAMVFWTPDEGVKEALLAAGAEFGNVYTVDELKSLVRHRVTAVELPMIHAARECFRGRLKEP